MADSLDELNNRLKQFARARNWEKFHNPKNLSMALIVEAAELVEHFQWLSIDESENLDAAVLDEVRMELADILIYLIRISEVLGVDLIHAARQKITVNEQRFPAEN